MTQDRWRWKTLPEGVSICWLGSLTGFPHSHTDFNLIFLFCPKNDVYDSPNMKGATCSFPWFIWTRWIEKVVSIQCKRRETTLVCLLTLLLSFLPRDSARLASLLFLHPLLVSPPHPLPPHCLRLSGLIFVFILDLRGPELPFQGFKCSHPFDKYLTCSYRKEGPAHLLFQNSRFLSALVSCSNSNWFLSLFD